MTKARLINWLALPFVVVGGVGIIWGSPEFRGWFIACVAVSVLLQLVAVWLTARKKETPDKDRFDGANTNDGA